MTWNDWRETKDLDDWRLEWAFSTARERREALAELDVPTFVVFYAWACGRRLTDEELELVAERSFPDRFARACARVRATRLLEGLLDALKGQRDHLERALETKRKADTYGEAAEFLLGELESLLEVA